MMAPVLDLVQRHGLGALACEVQSGKMKRIVSLSNELRDFRLQALQMTLHDFGGGDRHGRVDKNLRRFRQSIMVDALADEIKQFLRSLQCEGGDDNISTAFEGIRHGVIELLDGRSQGLVQPVSIRGFHHHVVDVRRLRGIG